MNDDDTIPSSNEPLGSPEMREIVAAVKANQESKVSDRLQRSKVFRADGSQVPASTLPSNKKRTRK